MSEDRQRFAIHAAVFAALANPTRHELMHHLCDSPRTPSELAELLGVSRPNVSQHLAVLQRDGLVRRLRQDGRVLWEVVNPRLSEACALIDEILGPELALRAHALEHKRGTS
jgi:DNA-binding transcriptional ArsR family regulator